MSKRFPIPEFDRDQYKNLSWEQPRLLNAQEQAKLVERATAGDASAYGMYAVEASDAFYERFGIRGEHRHVVMCLLPRTEVKVQGRSWAWAIQRALLVDSLDPTKARVVQEWKTPRPMNTRLGPDDGVKIEGGVVYAVFGHRYSDHWVSNRTLPEARDSVRGKGFGVVSSSDPANNDFHSCNVSFSWA